MRSYPASYGLVGARKALGGLGPVAGDAAPVPAQQGLWRDEPAGSLRSGQGRHDSTKQGPVLIGQLRPVVAAVQHAELVP